MLVKSEAILLKKTPYSDNSAVFQIFTRSYGVQSFIIQGLHGRSGKAALLQPGNLLEIVFYYQANRNLKRVKEVHFLKEFNGYGDNPIRLQILLFCLELSQKCLPDEQEDVHTFDFLKEQFLQLSHTDSLTWFPLQFLLRFASICGLGLQLPDAQNTKAFQMESPGPIYKNTRLNPLQSLDENEVKACICLLNNTTPSLDLQARRLLTEKLLYYFKMHLFPEQEIKSYHVLLEVLG